MKKFLLVLAGLLILAVGSCVVGGAYTVFNCTDLGCGAHK